MRIAKQLAHTTIGILFCLLAGALLGFLTDISPAFGPRLPLLMPIIAIAYGAAVGDILTRNAIPPRTDRLETIAAIGLIAGSLGGRLFVCLLALTPNCIQPPDRDPVRVLAAIVLSPLFLITLAAAICAAVVRIRILRKRQISAKHP